MPQIKFKHVISFTSEDPKSTSENLITGLGPWLGSPNERSGNIKAEFQLQKAVTIDYIDIGNFNSAMVCIEVGRSSWPTSQDFQSLLATVVLMTAAECRAASNLQTVRMFKKDNLDEKTRSEKWDRIRVTCSQPFRKNTQFGLAFLKLYTQEDVEPHTCTERANPSSCSNEAEEGKKKLINSLNFKQTDSVKMSESLRSLETCRMNNDETNSVTGNHLNKEINSPISRAAKLVMARKHVPNQNDTILEKKTLEMEALNFLISINLTYEDIQSLKVSHIREEFERRRKKVLTTREKIIFKNISLDYATERLNKFEQNNEIDGKEDIHCWNGREEDNCRSKSPNKTSNPSIVPSLNRSVSAKRAWLRKEEDIMPNSPAGAKRNNLALTDCNVTPTGNFKFKSEGSEKKRKRNSSASKSLPFDTNGVWLSPKPNQIPSHSSFKSFQYSTHCKNNYTNGNSENNNDTSKGLLPSSAATGLHKNERNGFKLDSNPRNKLGVPERHNSNNNELHKPNSPPIHLDLVECPLCTDCFPASSIEEHASNCSENTNSVIYVDHDLEQSSRPNIMEECPICGNLFDNTELNEHANECANEMFK